MKGDNDELMQQVYAAPVLVVDDERVCNAFIHKALSDKGFTTIITVESGEAALSYLQQHRPALVVLDIFMPGISGLECCEWIRQHPILHDIPVLMLTHLTDEAFRLKSFAVGATDFVCKPLHPQELCARVKIHLVNHFSLQRLQRYKDRLDTELKRAREMQSAILPTEVELQEVCGRFRLDVSTYLTSCSELGGDFWGMKPLSRHQVAFWMVDVSGHGVAAALNAFCMQAYMKETSTLMAFPGEYLAYVNEKLRHIFPSGYFATMFYGVVDTAKNQLVYACASNPHPLLRRGHGGVERMDGSGFPLGICASTYATQRLAFNPGDALVLYSDALTETANAEGIFLTEEQLMAVLSTCDGVNASKVQQRLLDYFAGHVSAPPTDDLTLCVIQRLE